MSKTAWDVTIFPDGTVTLKWRSTGQHVVRVEPVTPDDFLLAMSQVECQCRVMLNRLELRLFAEQLLALVPVEASDSVDRQ